MEKRIVKEDQGITVYFRKRGIVGMCVTNDFVMIKLPNQIAREYNVKLSNAQVIKKSRKLIRTYAPQNVGV